MQLIRTIAVLILTSSVAVAWEPPAAEKVQGLYRGTWQDAAGSPDAEIRVVAVGDDSFKLLARRKLGDKVERAQLQGKLDAKSGGLVFKGKAGDAAWSVNYADGKLKGRIGKEGSLTAERVQPEPPTLGKAPPKGAVVLLDGENVDQMERSGGRQWYLGDMSQHGWPIWEVPLVFSGAKEPAAWPSKDKPLPPGWKVSSERRKIDMVIGIGEDGSIQVPKGGMQSKQSFPGSFDAHVEFRCNFVPKARSQGRGNSGVHLPNGQEIQVLDSFGMPTYLGGGCGGLYKWKDPDTMEPLVGEKNPKESKFNLASLPPLTWQTYDIEFREKVVTQGDHANKNDKKEAGKGKDKGKAKPKKKTVKKGFLTVYHNGVKIHDAVEVRTGGGKFRFQDHGNPVRYRNIWVVPR